MSSDLEENMRYINEQLAVDTNFDVVYRVIEVGGRKACMYFIDGFCKDEMMQKLLQYFITIAPKDMPETAYAMSKRCMPHVEVD
ncbi:MAG: spore germination protein, partial [Lachnospiraceae bacterium]|nr:spore germination protein [Lachnospiraceae bacterium]